MKRRILNLGAGTQSSVLLIMADRGEIEPVEVAIFDDTQAEPREVYDHLDWLEKQVKTPIVRVTAGNMREAALVYQKSHKPLDGNYASLPLWVLNGGIQKRQCTKYFKIIPTRRYVRRVMKVKSATFLFGMSFDERDRVSTPNVKWITHEYPLIDKKLRRQSVIDLAEKWFPDHRFPRSACIECPYRRNDEWRNLTPEEFEVACQVDERLREADINAGSSGVFLHRSRVPLRQADLRDDPSIWDGVAENDCEGMCGV